MVELIRSPESVVASGAFFWREVVLCVGGGEGEEREGESGREGGKGGRWEGGCEGRKGE